MPLKEKILRDWINCSSLKKEYELTKNLEYLKSYSLIEFLKDRVTDYHFCELSNLNPRKAMSQSLSWVEC